MEHSDWLQRCLVRKLGAASDFLGANIRILFKRLGNIVLIAACILLPGQKLGRPLWKNRAVQSTNATRNTLHAIMH
jgi:hypothetical protein